MPKVLSQAGSSLADVYDVVGSIAGVERIVTQEVQLVHEMGGTIFSERFRTALARDETGDILQTVAFNRVIPTDATIPYPPDVPTRLLGVRVIADADRVSNVMLAFRDSRADREMPFFVWDGTIDDAVPVRWSDDGAAVASEFDLRPTGYIALPSFTAGEDAHRNVRNIAFRGLTTTFGAGTVNVRVLLYMAFAELGGVSSKGLPLPGW